MKENKNTPPEATSPLETFGRQIADFIINSPCQLAIDIRKAVRGEAPPAQTSQPSQTATAAKTPPPAQTPKTSRQPKLEDLGWVDNIEASRLLGITVRALQAHRLRGNIPFSLIGNKVYFRLEDIKQMLEKRYTGHASTNATKGRDQ